MDHLPRAATIAVLRHYPNLLVKHGALPDPWHGHGACSCSTATTAATGGGVTAKGSRLENLLHVYKHDGCRTIAERLIKAATNCHRYILELLVETTDPTDDVQQEIKKALAVLELQLRFDAIKHLVHVRNMADVSGQVLRLAVMFSRYDVAETLLRHGANINGLDRYGKTLLDEYQRNPIRNFLRRHGGLLSSELR